MLQKPLKLSRSEVAYCCLQMKSVTLTQVCLSLLPLGPLYLATLAVLISTEDDHSHHFPLHASVCCPHCLGYSPLILHLYLLSSWKLSPSRLLQLPPLGPSLLEYLCSWSGSLWLSRISSFFISQCLVSPRMVEMRLCLGTSSGEGTWKEHRGGGWNSLPFSSLALTGSAS